MRPHSALVFLGKTHVKVILSHPYRMPRIIARHADSTGRVFMVPLPFETFNAGALRPAMEQAFATEIAEQIRRAGLWV
jgi:hypothetical protein